MIEDILLSKFLLATLILSDEKVGLSHDDIDLELCSRIYRLLLLINCLDKVNDKLLHETLLSVIDSDFENIIDFISIVDFKNYTLNDRNLKEIIHHIISNNPDAQLDKELDIEDYEIDNLVHAVVKYYLKKRQMHGTFNQKRIDKYLVKLSNTFYLPRFALKEVKTLSNKWSWLAHFKFDCTKVNCCHISWKYTHITNR